MSGDKGKRILIHLSSSSSSSSSDVGDGSCSASSSPSSGEEWESCDGEDDDVDVYEVEDSEEADREEEDETSSSGNGRQGARNDNDNDNNNDNDDDDDSLSNRVTQYLQEKKDLRKLSLKACKAYLRKHGLRVSGNKEVCARRVQEHWRIRDGKAVILYPRSSFVINCKGDVCRGDTVLFTQKVHGRRGKPHGHRTVAGRVVKESYGAAKQQHTFTVEVLWSKGLKKLPPLFPLLVKGRNLYRLKTYRQPWRNEEARRKVLAEKHRRGTVARTERATRKKAQFTSKGGNSQRSSHPTRQSQMGYTERRKSDGRDRMVSSPNHSTNQFDYQHHAGACGIGATSSKSFPRHQLILPNDRASELQPYHERPPQYPQLVGSHHRSIFHNEIPPHHPMAGPATQYDGVQHRPLLHDSYGISSQWIGGHADSSQFLTNQRRNDLLKCSVRGCNECGSDRCVIAACWRCCRRERLRCSAHR